MRRGNACRPLLRANGEAFGKYHLRDDSYEAKDGAQICLGVFERFRRRAGTMKTAARDGEDHAFVARQAFMATIRVITEGLTRHQDPINPGFELARNRKIVNGDPDHHSVSGHKFLQRGKAVGKIHGNGGGVLARRRPRSAQIFTGQMRYWRSGQITVNNL